MSYYSLANKKLGEFLEVIKKVKPPEGSVGVKWLELLGFKTKSHRAFFPLLQQINFLDNNKEVTPLYLEFRVERTTKSAMAKGLKAGYSILWDVYEEPYRESAEALVDIFKANGMGEDLAKRAESTFRLFVDFADFDA